MTLLPLDEKSQAREATLEAKRQAAIEQDKLDKILAESTNAAEALQDTKDQKALMEEEMLGDKEFAKRVRVLRRKYRNLLELVTDVQENYEQKLIDLEEVQVQIKALRSLAVREEQRVTEARRKRNELNREIESIEDSPSELRKEVKNLNAKKEALISSMEAEEGKMAIERGAIIREREESAKIKSDLAIYDRRIRREYKALFPDLPYKSPLEL